MATGQTDFNVEYRPAVTDMTAQLFRRTPDEERIAETIRRKLDDLQGRAGQLSEPQRSEYLTQLSRIESDLTRGQFNLGPILDSLNRLGTRVTEAEAVTGLNSVAAAMYDGVALSAAAQARIAIRAQTLTPENAQQFAETFFSDYDPTPPEVRREVSAQVAEVIRREPQMMRNWNALPQPVRHQASQQLEANNARAHQMAQDPAYQPYHRMLRQVEDLHLAGSPEGDAILRRIRERAPEQEVRNLLRDARNNVVRIAENHQAGIVAASAPQMESLRARGLAQGDDIDMAALLAAREQLGADWWRTRYAQHRTVPREQWPADFRQQYDIMMASNTVIITASVDNLTRLGQQIARQQGRDDLTPEQQQRLEQNTALYNTIRNTDGTATEDQRVEAVKTRLRTTNSAFATQSARQQDYLARAIVRDVDAAGEGEDNIYGTTELTAEQMALRTSSILEIARNFYTTPESLTARPAAPVVAVTTPAEGDSHHHDTRAFRNEGLGLRPGDRLDGLIETPIEDRIKRVLEGKEMRQIVATFGASMGQNNVGHQDNLTHHEIENQVIGNGWTSARDIDRDGDNRFSTEELLYAMQHRNPNARTTPRVATTPTPISPGQNVTGAPHEVASQNVTNATPAVDPALRR